MNKEKEKDKEKEKEYEEKRKEILREFIKNNEDNIISMSKKYTAEIGLGALFISLTPNSTDVDAEYFKVEDLDGNFKNKILEINGRANGKKYVYYAVRLYNTSYSFHKEV